MVEKQGQEVEDLEKQIEKQNDKIVDLKLKNSALGEKILAGDVAAAEKITDLEHELEILKLETPQETAIAPNAPIVVQKSVY